MDKIKSLLITLLAVAVVIIGIVSGDFFTSEHQPSGRQNGSNYDEVLIFPSDRYPETGAHIRKAIKKRALRNLYDRQGRSRRTPKGFIERCSFQIRL